MAQNGFSLRFWGVRGSHPISDRGSLKYGGNSSCVEVKAGDQRIIFDAGTGIIGLGKELVKKNQAPLILNLFLSHTHHDHLFGFYFFEPLFDTRNRVYIFGPRSEKRSLSKTLRAAMDRTLFPVGFDALRANKVIHSLDGNESIELRGSRQAPRVAKVVGVEDMQGEQPTVLTYKSAAHPNGVMLYRLCYKNKSVVYATDIEQKRGGYPEIIEFARGADVLIHDAQYLESEYTSRTHPRKCWGHSSVERAAEVAAKAGVKRLVLFHHEPTHDDHCIDQIVKQTRRRFPASVAAAEGMVISF
ncbi:MAG: MBL fold metallo-hydrolase [Deltaproteobacteria bacterium]|nr:MBL fold metallo-hydrolase [Deltaproteobacteria bacterium]